jgi:Na+-driven multidrug efflux pump
MLATMSLSGVFRGMRDTRTPLVALCVTTAVNMVLDPLFLKSARARLARVREARKAARARGSRRWRARAPERAPATPARPGGARHGRCGAPRCAARASGTRPLTRPRPRLRVRALHGLAAVLPRSAAVAGLGAATAVAQAAGVVILLAALRRRTPAGSAAAPRARLVRALASSASVMTARTFFGGLVYARASAGAAAASALAGAAHALTFNVWFNCALLADALAIAAQALLGAALPAAALRDSRADQAASAAASAAAMLEPTPRLIVARTARLAVGATVVLMVALMAGRDRVLALLTADPAVRAAAAVVWPVVVASQPACVLAFVADGLLFGARDFVGASLAMLGAAAPALLLLRGARPAGGAAAAELLRIWHTLALFMAVRATFALGWALRPGSPLLRDHTAIAYFDDDS